MNRYLYRHHKGELTSFPNCHLASILCVSASTSSSAQEGSDSPGWFCWRLQSRRLLVAMPQHPTHMCNLYGNPCLRLYWGFGVEGCLTALCSHAAAQSDATKRRAGAKQPELRRKDQPEKHWRNGFETPHWNCKLFRTWVLLMPELLIPVPQPKSRGHS